MKHKGLLFILVIVLMMVLAACGGGKTAVAKPADLVTDELNLADTVDVQTVAEIMNRGDVLLIDVREQGEYDETHIPGITLIPLNEVPQRMSEIPKDKTVILTCRSGNRSGQAADFLRENGYDNVHNMAGGIKAWATAGFETE